MTFCYSPWTNIDINAQGDIMPCCKFQAAPTDQAFNIQKNTVAEYLESAFVTEIKQEFKQGNWPTGCERCRIEEEHAIKSKRNLDFDRWHEHYDKVDIEQASILTASVAFGNTCNSKCITCGPRSSSRWQKEYNDIYKIDVAHVKFYKKGFVEDFVSQAPGLVHIDIPGGEPFLSGVQEQQSMLQHYIATAQAANITLHYTTNASIWPDDSWWDLWSHFAEVDLQLSIDGVGKRYEYIRYPLQWSMLETNVNKYLTKQSVQFRLSISHTVSAYNIYYLDEFFTWCCTVGLPVPWLGLAHHPAHMRPSVWPESVRNHIVEHLMSSSYQEVHEWARMLQKQNSSDQFTKFKTYLAQHDQYRGLSFAETFKELAEFLNDK